MNDVYVVAFNNQTFNQDDNESVILGIKYYNQPNRIIQHLSIKAKVKNIEVNKMRIGFIIAVLTFVDTCEIIKMGGKMIEL